MQTEKNHDNNTPDNWDSIHNLRNRVVRTSWTETPRPPTIFPEHFDNKKQKIYSIPVMGGHAENK